MKTNNQATAGSETRPTMFSACSACRPGLRPGAAKPFPRLGTFSVSFSKAWTIAAAALLLAAAGGTAAQAADPLAWPAITREARPWAYWWWMGSAVDKTNLTREIERARDAGLGGLHIVAIYGAKGWEDRAIPYLTPRWMEMLDWSVREAQRCGLGMDMTLGSGWCFGGPHVTDAEANARLVIKTFQLGAGERLKQKFERSSTQALVAFGPGGKAIDLTDSITTNGEVFFSPPGNWTGANPPPKTWTLYAVSQKPSGQKVKRAGPGGEGWMLNPFYGAALKHYLEGFSAAFAGYQGAKPRANYQDSYEYRSDWSPDLFAEFAKRRGYRLEEHLPAFVANEGDEARRVRADFHATISDLMIENAMPQWIAWSHAQGMLTRYQAHGSPGNWLDLYALADIPETEMFSRGTRDPLKSGFGENFEAGDRDPRVSKFASSAAHVAGHRLAASETCTWMAEHFCETLEEVKCFADRMFVSGINHMFYHGNCYSPDEAGWPGWHFYAATEMNPRNPIWHDARALNDYIARCQAVLQAGQPDNDVLLYWPLQDFWHRTTGSVAQMTVHGRDWLNRQAIGATSALLWQRGYGFDFVSDRQLRGASAAQGQVVMPGGNYRAIVVPPTTHMPLETLRALLKLAENGGTVIFQQQLPSDVPGWKDAEARRAELHQLLAGLKWLAAGKDVSVAALGSGRVLVGEAEAALAAAAVAREPVLDHAGVMFIRRQSADGHHYFLANQSMTALEGWFTLGVKARSVVLMDPLSGHTGVAATRANADGSCAVRLQVEPGHSVILRTFTDTLAAGTPWSYREAAGAPLTLAGPWQVEFIATPAPGGATLPKQYETAKLESWTKHGDPETVSFAGTARYTTKFDLPASLDARHPALLALGEVCHSAQVTLNGRALGTLIMHPYRVAIPAELLKLAGNTLEIEVTNLAANRIRDLDQRKVSWKNFTDINFVNIGYKPFDASAWPVFDSGLLGPVTLTPLKP